MADFEYILALDGLPGIEIDVGEYIEYINVQTKRYMGNTIHERIVRCKDCKHYRSGNRCWKFSYDNGATVVWGAVKPDGFCAWGVRRDD